MNTPKINFGEKIYREHEGANSFATSIANVSKNNFLSYIKSVESLNFKLFEEHSFGDALFRTYSNGTNALYLSFYEDIAEMRIVEEPSSLYLSYKDVPVNRDVQPLLTHIDLEDYGLSYVVRNSDGRFIIFDGGWEFEPDADKLMTVLNEQSFGQVPRIAAWIFTHPHLDHYRCFLPFHKKYKDKVIIEKFIYNFPDVTDESIKQMPSLTRNEDDKKLVEFYTCVNEVGAPVYRAHTGQIYRIGETVLEVLSSPDDTFFCPANDLNPLSLIIKMKIAGQHILWSGDAFFGTAKLAERYGKYLKSDIFQITHHGFRGGREKEHKLIDPAVCLAPVFEDDCFSYINMYYEHNRQLFFDLNVQEFIVGSSGNKILELPYIPSPNKKYNLFKMIDENQGSIGKKSWMFIDVSENEADFSIVNTTNFNIPVMANLYFDNENDMVYAIKIIAKSKCVTRANLFDETCSDPDAMYFNPRSLKNIGVRKSARFTVLFRSKIPVVIKGKNPADHCY